MNCSEVRDLLSPLHDGELSAELRESVEQHLRECPACAAVRTSFGAMSLLARELPEPEPHAELWNQIEAELPRAHSRPVQWLLSAESFRELARRSRILTAAVTAVVLVLAGTTLVVYDQFHDRRDSNGHDEHLAVNFDQFLNEFPKSPEHAQELLHASYPSNLVDVDQAAFQVKYRPAVSNRLPKGYTLDSVHLVRMPCCLCVEALCTGPGGSRVAVLEHAIDQPVWFGDRPASECNCGGRKARMVKFDSHYAATWKSARRYLTVIGIRDEDELREWIQHLDRPEA
ncbi:hypothetical protein GC176_23705 [bacterium]|nr:hypothetical protein [bacterium]